MTDPIDLVRDIFVGSQLLRETPRAADTLGMVELARYLTDPGAQLTLAQRRRIVEDPALNQGYQALKNILASYRMPQLMAASSDDMLGERVFDAGTIRLIPSSRPGQTYLRIDFRQPPGKLNAVLILEGADGVIHKFPFAMDGASHRLLALLDVSDTAQAQLVQAIGDPRTSGAVLRLDGDARPS